MWEAGSRPGHHWMRDLLVERGVDPARIAILNAEDTKDFKLRQQIAEAWCPRGGGLGSAMRE